MAFAVPVEGLTRIVDVSQASHGAPAHPTTTLAGGGTGGSAPPPPPAPPIVTPTIVAPPAVSHLTLGVGEGRQPPPEYPREAILARQEGTVVLRFQVDETGRVTTAEIITPARWPLLNQAATHAVRDTWHFAPGPVRRFEVPIQFQLSRN
jgi:protein TonB